MLGGFQGNSALEAALRQQYGNQPSPDSFQKQHDDAATKLAAAHQPSDYTAVATIVTQQNTAMTSLLIRSKALYDYKQFDTLVRSDAVWKRTIINKQPNPRFNPGGAYPLAYEYMGEDGLLDNDIGIGPASKPESYARTDKGFQSADFRITSLMANLRAMLDNYDPATDEVNAMDDNARINPVHEKPHATDLQLMQYYNVMAARSSWSRCASRSPGSTTRAIWSATRTSLPAIWLSRRFLVSGRRSTGTHPPTPIAVTGIPRPALEPLLALLGRRYRSRQDSAMCSRRRSLASMLQPPSTLT